MKIITKMLSDFIKKLRIIYLIQQDNISYCELIEFLYGETPPEDHNFLTYDYAPYIANIAKFVQDKKTSPIFSVIIPTYNRHELLKKTLEAIARQREIRAEDIEIIVADNGSIDKTEETVIDFFKNGPSGAYIRLNKNYGADFARNVAFLNSLGDFLAFTDDDCIVPPDWLLEFKKELDADPAIAGVGGFKIPKSTREHLDIYHRFLMWRHFYYPHIRTKYPYNRYGLTANVCYRRGPFIKLGGFNKYFKRIGFEDFKTRAHKSGLKLLYEPKMVEHFAYFTFSDHFLKLFPQSLDRYLLHKLHPNVWPNPSFLYFLKKTKSDIELILNYPTAQESSRNLMRFSFVSIVTNFFLWFGKYWIIAFR